MPTDAETSQAGEHAATVGPLLIATDVHRHFEGMRAVDGVSIDVLPGRLTGLIGPNGAGKSTFLAVLAGTLPASSGSIVFDGEDITRLPTFRRARLGLVRTFQLPSEFAQLTVMENLLAAAPDNRGESVLGALRGRRYWEKDESRLVEQARELLARFRMTEKEDQYAGDLSGGQKRLVEIMRALMLQPRLLLLDEPMAGVHPSIVGEIASYLGEPPRRGPDDPDGRAPARDRRAPLRPGHRDGPGQGHRPRLHDGAPPPARGYRCLPHRLASARKAFSPPRR